MLGVALSLRRMWTSGAPSAEAAWYGAELAGNTRAVEQAWRVLVDAIPSASAAIEVH